MDKSELTKLPEVKKPLAGKSALITGACRNLGRVTAEALARSGAHVVVNDLDTTDSVDAGERVVGDLRALGVHAEFIPADLSRASEVRRLCREATLKYGTIDILVNNAGPFAMDPYLTLRETTWNLVMDVNLKAVYLAAQELGPRMKQSGWGRIITMCAGSAFIRNHSVYTLAKSGVKILTESLALELGPSVTVNAVAPGQIQESLEEVESLQPGFGQRALSRTPLQRLVTRSEVACLIALLCTPAFDMMTGMTIRLDGGAEIPRF
jgi:NAD(P)-dependent dehydrogenase (short-subunit alcohol dehydrogenase family)